MRSVFNILIPVSRQPLIDYLIVVPVTEEVIRYIYAKQQVGKITAIDTYSVMLATVYVHAGFATIENIMYLTNNLSWIVTAIRAYMAVPMHLIYGLIMSHFLYIFAQSNNNAYLIPALLFPILLHGTLDYSIISKVYAVPLILPGICTFLSCKYVKRRANSAVPREDESGNTPLEM